MKYGEIVKCKDEASCPSLLLGAGGVAGTRQLVSMFGPQVEAATEITHATCVRPFLRPSWLPLCGCLLAAAARASEAVALTKDTSSPGCRRGWNRDARNVLEVSLFAFVSSFKKTNVSLCVREATGEEGTTCNMYDEEEGDKWQMHHETFCRDQEHVLVHTWERGAATTRI